MLSERLTQPVCGQDAAALAVSRRAAEKNRSSGSGNLAILSRCPPNRRLGAHSDRLGMKPLQIPANSDRLGETVIKFQDRRPTRWVLCEELGFNSPHWRPKVYHREGT